MTLEQKKKALIDKINRLDAMKAHKKFVILCLKHSDYAKLGWFFWESFIFDGGAKRTSVGRIYDALPINMRKAFEQSL